ncbi:MAG TPA: formate--tetrahydrofolate ligase [Thermoplasmata archaeon]|nr:formate--tetrahydrofolate ligase [Thermoplasmata archaeon]
MTTRPISEIADLLDLAKSDRIPRRADVLKVPVRAVRERVRPERRGRLVLVTAMTPTPHGEGKTVTAIGLAEGLSRVGRRAVVCLRQPSLGPVFGIKGGAAGAGRALVEPAVAINLGLTGDIDAVGHAHNLIAAMLDNHLTHGNALDIDPTKIRWPRTLDTEDRPLRQVRIGVDGAKGSVARDSSFVITAASEVMAVLGLARDYADLRQRLGRILLGERRDGRPVRAEDIGATGAAAALLRDALEPNLVQTAEGTPALVHGGPFGNIAHGTASRLSIELGLYSSEYALVEVGFGSDLGCEKFVDLVAPYADLAADAAVLVATVRALRYHGGETAEGAGDRLAHLRAGLANLEKHVENVRRFGLPTVIALNKFPDDQPEELAAVREFALALGVPIEVSDGYGRGGAGTEELANRVVELAARGQRSRPLYTPGTSIVDAVDRVVREVYGGDGVEWLPSAEADLGELDRWEEAGGPVCIAKTQLSLSDDPHQLGRPRHFTLHVNRVTRSAGAAFTVVQSGRISLMPGLPSTPAARSIDLDPDGTVRGVR